MVTDRRMPNAMVGAVSLTVMLVLSAGYVGLGHHASRDAALVATVVVVAVIGYAARPVAAAMPAAFGWLGLNGFVYDTMGTLRWHGNPDLVRLVVVFGVALTASRLRAVQVRLARPAVVDDVTIDLDSRRTELSPSFHARLGDIHA